ncbi:unnamed protein product [Clonostachys chloroleuca]|uniref:Uncharacterized protein n=1 Tax=Clonostachys chloroleuca TaxID=1926264 RepID=A0AA35Q517_9HYPO|nr:unnamed protein product [Clonostachys chloroleuca]
MATLALPNLSQTHWVARSCWISSLITSLLAVYFATSQAWTISQLTSEKGLRRWVHNTDDAGNDGIRLWMALNGNDNDNDDNQNEEEEQSEQLLAGLAPALSSTITVSAPSLLLSSSLLLLLAGMGVFLGFVWSRDLDVDAGVGDNKSVFVVYVVVLGVSLALTGVFALGQRPVPARSVILGSLMKLDAAPTAEKVEKSDLVGQIHPVSSYPLLLFQRVHVLSGLVGKQARAVVGCRHHPGVAHVIRGARVLQAFPPSTGIDYFIKPSSGQGSEVCLSFVSY